MQTCTCPICNITLYEDEDLIHDGYQGSPYAHNGRGSYGLGRHHYCFACSNCGWLEGETVNQTQARQRSERASHAAKQRGRLSGLVLPASVKSRDETVTLRCRSRMTKTEKLAWEIAQSRGELGGINDHTLCATYRYAIVSKAVFATAESLVKTGNVQKSVYRWMFQQALADEAYNSDDH